MEINPLTLKVPIAIKDNKNNIPIPIAILLLRRIKDMAGITAIQVAEATNRPY